MNTQCVIFDLGKVLIDFSVDKACRQIADLAQCAPADVRAFLFDTGLEYRFEAGEFTFDELHQQFELKMQQQIDKDQLAYASADIFSAIPESLELLRSLRATHAIPMILLSNTNSVHWEFITRTWEIQRMFDACILSFEVRAMKPDPKIYEHALRHAGIPPSQCFFTDDIPENIAGAKRLGIDAVLFQSAAQIRRELSQRGLQA